MTEWKDWIASCLAMTETGLAISSLRSNPVTPPSLRACEAIQKKVDCFVPRNDGMEGLDCFIPRNDGMEGLDCFIPRNDGMEGLDCFVYFDYAQ